MSILCSLNTLVGNPLVSGTASTYLLMTYDLILDFFFTTQT
jgi:hypothetical protein